MDHLAMFFTSFFYLYFHVKAQTTPSTSTYLVSSKYIIHQSIELLLVIPCFLFFVMFILLIYPKLRFLICGNRHPNELTSNTISGIHKSLIDSLPLFTFSSLRGSKEGLECAVCLSMFEDTEVLRLLPKCKHAFHGSCVDKWLENNSSCPLCRQKVDIEDIRMFKLSSSFRIPHTHPDARVGMPTCTSDPPQSSERQESSTLGSPYNLSDRDIELFVQIGESADREDTSTEKEINKTHMHKFKHKIIVHGVVFKHRWSDVNSSDIISLNSDMIDSTTNRSLSSFNLHSEPYIPNMLDNATFPKDDKEVVSKRLSDRGSSVSNKSIPSTSDIKPKSGRLLSPVITSRERSQSEITTLTRFSDFSGGNNVEEERMRAWLAITKKTVQWVGNKERSKQSQCSGEQLMV